MKILYLSCHQILEYNEVALLDGLGHEVFSAGYYLDPEFPLDTYRDSLPKVKKSDPSLLHEFQKLNPSFIPGNECNLSLEFINKFDVVITVFHFQGLRNLGLQNIKPRIVVRSPGQPSGWYESNATFFKNNNAKIVRFSPSESNALGFAGEDALIRVTADPSVYNAWVGGGGYVLTFCNAITTRSACCNLKEYLKLVSMGGTFELYGYGNEALEIPQNKGKVAAKEQQDKYKNCNTYLNLGSKPAPYTYSILEALSCGIPVITWGKYLGSENIGRGLSFEIPDLFEHGKDLISSDSLEELFYYINLVSVDASFAQQLGKSGKDKCLKVFSKEQAVQGWTELFKTI